MSVCITQWDVHVVPFSLALQRGTSLDQWVLLLLDCVSRIS
jgi:hypothetical protein